MGNIVLPIEALNSAEEVVNIQIGEMKRTVKKLPVYKYIENAKMYKEGGDESGFDITMNVIDWMKGNIVGGDEKLFVDTLNKLNIEWFTKLALSFLGNDTSGETSSQQVDDLPQTMKMDQLMN